MSLEAQLREELKRIAEYPEGFKAQLEAYQSYLDNMLTIGAEDQDKYNGSLMSRLQRGEPINKCF